MRFMSFPLLGSIDGRLRSSSEHQNKTNWSVNFIDQSVLDDFLLDGNSAYDCAAASQRCRLSHGINRTSTYRAPGFSALI
jgi:hypothetical protein